MEQQNNAVVLLAVLVLVIAALFFACLHISKRLLGPRFRRIPIPEKRQARTSKTNKPTQ